MLCDADVNADVMLVLVLLMAAESNDGRNDGMNDADCVDGTIVNGGGSPKEINGTDAFTKSETNVQMFVLF